MYDPDQKNILYIFDPDHTSIREMMHALVLCSPISFDG